MKLKSKPKQQLNAETYDSSVLEQWKLCVEMANHNSDRRNSSNALFITINSAIFAVITFSLDYKSILLSIIGIIVCVLWLNMIKSYASLSTVKYQIINEMERLLPLAPFAYEWDKLQNEHKYKDLTKMEKTIPWLFISLYILAILIPVGKILLNIYCSNCAS